MVTVTVTVASLGALYASKSMDRSKSNQWSKLTLTSSDRKSSRLGLHCIDAIDQVAHRNGSEGLQGYLER